MAIWNSILCGVDSSSKSIDALRCAANLARDVGGRLTLLHVDAEPRGEMMFAPPASWRQKPPPDDECWAVVATEIRGERVELHYATGDPAERIVEFARKQQCDVIVLGSHVHHRASLLLGSVLGKVLATAPCAVVVVPAREA
ncbi:MAG TPA: universal stress protein [Myxococcales bacterium]|nr:universal stress protein [Myxococcales bacterium]